MKRPNKPSRIGRIIKPKGAVAGFQSNGGAPEMQHNGFDPAVIAERHDIWWLNAKGDYFCVMEGAKDIPLR